MLLVQCCWCMCEEPAIPANRSSIPDRGQALGHRPGPSCFRAFCNKHCPTAQPQLLNHDRHHRSAISTASRCGPHQVFSDSSAVPASFGTVEAQHQRNARPPGSYRAAIPILYCVRHGQARPENDGGRFLVNSTPVRKGSLDTKSPQRADTTSGTGWHPDEIAVAQRDRAGTSQRRPADSEGMKEVHPQHAPRPPARRTACDQQFQQLRLPHGVSGQGWHT